MPWDVLVNRLERFLRVAYVSAVLAGLVLAAEVTVLALRGTPQERRDQVAEAASSVADLKPNAILLVALLAVALTAAYLLGVASRSLTYAVVLALINTVNLTRHRIARWWHGTRTGPDGEEVVPHIPPDA